jgi:probable O-glycosylation ligase (exosortase A-associated)
MLYAGFLISVFLEYVRPGSYLPIINATKINSVIPLLVFAYSLFYKGPVDNSKVFEPSNTKWILFFLALLGISVLHAEVTMYSYNILKVVLGFVFLYYIILRLITDIDKVKGLFAIIVISHVTLLALNPQVVLNPATRSYIYENPFLGDGNDFSLSVCISIPMCIFLIMESKKLVVRLFFIAALLALIFAIVGTQSRGATVALACVFLYLWWAGRQKVLGILFIGAVLAVVVNYAPPVYFERLNTIKNYETEGSAQGRIVAWKTALRMAGKYPFTGVGTGHFAVKLGTEFRPPEFGSENLPWLTAHSVYFLVMGELGVPGISAILIILVGNFFKNTRYARQARGSPDPHMESYRRLFIMLNASLVAFAVGGAFLSVAYYPHLYILTGIFTAVQLMYIRDREGGASPLEEKAAWYENDPARAEWQDDQKVPVDK